jgi:predicted metal-dependent phosphoesterase TrpH
MDFVTITDHDTIDGVLTIADQPHVFLSEEITTYFPQDPCKLHLLVWGFSEAQRAELQPLRENIFELQAYLQNAGLATPSLTRSTASTASSTRRISSA